MKIAMISHKQRGQNCVGKLFGATSHSDFCAWWNSKREALPTFTWLSRTFVRTDICLPKHKKQSHCCYRSAFRQDSAPKWTTREPD